MVRKYDTKTAWACINTIMRYIGEPEVLQSEIHSVAGDAKRLDPVEVAHKIRQMRAVEEILKEGNRE